VGSHNPQDLVLPGLIPHRILFCRVSDPAGKLRPRRIRQKSFKSLPFSLKGHFLKMVCMYKLYYPRLIVSVLKEPPILKMFFLFCGVLEHESGAHMGLIHEKNQRPKISCYCPFKKNSVYIVSSWAYKYM
jgi:hypothetical protein